MQLSPLATDSVEDHENAGREAKTCRGTAQRQQTPPQHTSPKSSSWQEPVTDADGTRGPIASSFFAQSPLAPPPFGGAAIQEKDGITTSGADLVGVRSRTPGATRTILVGRHPCDGRDSAEGAVMKQARKWLLVAAAFLLLPQSALAQQKKKGAKPAAA